jgi:hypothetical protein
VKQSTQALRHAARSCIRGRWRAGEAARGLEACVWLSTERGAWSRLLTLLVVSGLIRTPSLRFAGFSAFLALIKCLFLFHSFLDALLNGCQQ